MIEIPYSDIPYVSFDPPPPFDLAFSARWHLVEKDKDYTGYGLVQIQGKTRKHALQPPLGLLEDMAEPGEHPLTIKIILEPSLEAALNNPDIEAYWPRPIELPEFEMKVKVWPRDEQPEPVPAPDAGAEDPPPGED